MDSGYDNTRCSWGYVCCLAWNDFGHQSCLVSSTESRHYSDDIVGLHLSHSLPWSFTTAQGLNATRDSILTPHPPPTSLEINTQLWLTLYCKRFHRESYKSRLHMTHFPSHNHFPISFRLALLYMTALPPCTCCHTVIEKFDTHPSIHSCNLLSEPSCCRYVISPLLLCCRGDIYGFDG